MHAPYRTPLSSTAPILSFSTLPGMLLALSIHSLQLVVELMMVVMVVVAMVVGTLIESCSCPGILQRITLTAVVAGVGVIR